MFEQEHYCDNILANTMACTHTPVYLSDLSAFISYVARLTPTVHVLVQLSTACYVYQCRQMMLYSPVVLGAMD